MKMIASCFTAAYVVMIFIALQPKTETGLFIFYTGEVQGELEPCGCSGVKSGGILQKGAWVEHLRHTKPQFLVVDGGFAATKDDKQQQIKFNYYHQMLPLIGVDFTVFTEKEILDSKWQAANKNNMHSVVHKNGKIILITRLETAQDFQLARQNIDTINPDIVVYMTRGVGVKVPENAPLGKYLSVFIVTDAKEPVAAFEAQKNVLVMAAGNRGRYAGLLRITRAEKNLQWAHEHVTITEEYRPSPEMTQTLEMYKKKIRMEKLLDLEVKRSSRVGFVGTDMCRSCHVEEYQSWLLQQDHAKAFATLQVQNYDYDPECVKCHVVGYEYVEGFRNFEESDYLIHVGCESCHGAGAEHAFNPLKFPNYGKTKGADSCTVCHNKDHSAKFDYAKYKLEIKHWKSKVHEKK